MQMPRATPAAASPARASRSFTAADASGSWAWWPTPRWPPAGASPASFPAHWRSTKSPMPGLRRCTSSRRCTSEKQKWRSLPTVSLPFRAAPERSTSCSSNGRGRSLVFIGRLVASFNVNGYFDPLKEMTLRMVAEGFLHESYAGILAFTDDLDVLLTHLHSFVPPNRKWQTEASAKVQS